MAVNVLITDCGIIKIFKERQLIRCKQLLISGKIHNKNLSILRTPPKPRKEMLIRQEDACHINISLSVSDV